MGRYFEFDRKIGWAHLVSVLALLVSVLSLWTASRLAGPRIIISRESSTGGPFVDDSGKVRFFGYDRIVFSNVGGRPVTLIGLRPPKEPPFPNLFAAYIRDGRAQEARSEIFLIEDFFEDLARNPKAIASYKGWSRERLTALHRLIPSGGTTTVTLGMLLDVYEGNQPVTDYVVTNVEFYFSDGSAQPYHMASQLYGVVLEPANQRLQRTAGAAR